MVYSSKDFESLWFLYQAEGLPKNISIEEFCTKHGVDYPTFDKWYKKTHKKVYPVTVMGMPAEEEAEIQSEAEKVSEESKVHDSVKHPFKYPTDRVANINKKISISIKLPDTAKCWTGMCYFVKNVMKFLRELCHILTEIWKLIINMVTEWGYVCTPVLVARC